MSCTMQVAMVVWQSIDAIMGCWVIVHFELKAFVSFIHIPFRVHSHHALVAIR